MNFYAITSQQILERISRHCPEALCTYLHCVNRSGKDGSIFFSRDQVDVELSESWRFFRNNIKKLALEDLLEWHPFNNGIAVTMADLDDEGENSEEDE